MNFLQRLTQQFTELYRSMAPSQRATLIVVPLLVVSGFAWLLLQQGNDSYTAMSWGKVYTSEELIAAEQALIQAGHHDFRREGQRLMVPANKAAEYNAALLRYDAVPSGMGSQLLKQYQTLGPFSTEKERQERREALLLEEVRRVLRAVPEIEDAGIIIANSGRKSWSQKSKVTATVSVRTRAGFELPTKLIRSIRTAVASMVPDLQPADVTIFDSENGVSHAGESDSDPLNGQLVQRIDQFQGQYERQISQALSYIPDVGVTVNVDLDNLKSSVVRNQVVDPKKFAPVYSQETNLKDTQTQQPARGEPGQAANRPASIAVSPGIDRNRQFSDGSTQAVNGVSFEVSEKELIAAMPKAVQVNVTVPRDYYRTVAAQRQAAGETDAALLDPAKIEQAVLANVSASVKALIPADSPTTAVTVNSVDRVRTTPPPVAVPMTDQVWQWLQQWGGAVVLTVLALYALMALRRSAPPVEPPAPEMNLDQIRSTNESINAAAPALPRELTQRDMVQTLVRDNPEATAAIISKWLQAAQ
ncbi:MAG: hypothetical protein B7Z55_01355 [Planctomycetales bacterium 12-60-4]|nr:MAG: hypothetical protein B7Z55_01355 [Planctomycetales bacterium 12-60-4]